MLRLYNLKLPLDYQDTTLYTVVSKALGVPTNRILSCKVSRKSIDARKKGKICFVVSLDVQLAVSDDEEKRIASLLPASVGGVLTPYSPPKIPALSSPPLRRPVVVGFGPAGMFAALTLAEAGACPIILERGKDVDSRTQDVHHYWQGGSKAFLSYSNVQFGEGGAGTFSDGKLNTGIKDPIAEHVLRSLVRFGAPSDILTDAKPHIGTDYLAKTVKALRQYIVSLGAEIHFESKLLSIIHSNGHVVAVEYEKKGALEELKTDQVILAIGHSARDTLECFYNHHFTILQKPFSMGVRIEHPQRLINLAQYGRQADNKHLKAADYKLSVHLPSGRSVYTFCMCPGGRVIAAASEDETIVTNGMSFNARSEENANSAVLVGISPEDFGSSHPLAGMYMQRSIEQLAFQLGGRNGSAPCQSVGDLLCIHTKSGLGEVVPTYLPGVQYTDLTKLYPSYIMDSIKAALPCFAHRIKGFDMPEALLTGPETRSSSPVRLPRKENTVSVDIEGLHPCGEGAGYAGGITSAAVDGVHCAQSVLQFYAEKAI